MRAHASLLTLVLVIGAGCSDDGGALIVELQTDYLPGVEFGAARTELVGASVMPVTNAFFRENDFSDGERVAELSGLAAGTYEVRVTLLGVDDGRPIAEVSARVALETNRATRLRIARGSSACGGDADCGAAACASGRCLDGVCFAFAEHARCSGSSCHPLDGCASGPPADAGDGGPEDAATDSATPDASRDGGASSGPLLRIPCDGVIENVGRDSSLTTTCTECPRLVAGGFRGGACELDGSTGLFVEGLDDLSGSFSVAAWVFLNGPDGSLVAKLYGAEAKNSFQLEVDTGRPMATYTDGPVHRQEMSSTRIDDAAWHHMAMTYDERTTTVSLYVDGEFISASVVAIAWDDGQVLIGFDRNRGEYNWHLRGLLDDIALWDRALTATEVDAERMR